MRSPQGSIQGVGISATDLATARSHNIMVLSTVHLLEKNPMVDITV